MKYGRLIFAFTTLALAACNNTKSTDVVGNTRPAVGTFKFDGQEHFSEDVGDGKFAMVVTKEYLSIAGDRVSLRRTCRVGDETTVVEGSATAEVNDTHFVLATPIQKEVRIGKFKCAIKRGAGVWGYKVDGHFLTLTAADGTTESYGYEMGKRPSMLKRLGDTGKAVGEYIGEALTLSSDAQSQF